MPPTRRSFEVAKALNTPEVKDRSTAPGADARTRNSAAFDSDIREEIKTNATPVKAAGLEIHE